MTATASYILRGGDDGAARLRILGAATRATTLRLLERVGIAPGMRVLDLGCGSGEVAVELAHLVGPGGRVVGVDGDAAMLAHARARAAAEGVRVELVRGDARRIATGGPYDVAYARFLLSHLEAPLATLEQLRAALRPGGRLVVEDVDFPGHLCDPPSAAFARYVELYQAAARHRGGDAAIGPRLPALLRGAGLADVQVEVAQPTFLDGDGKRVAQLTLAAIGPTLVEAGIASAVEVDELVTALDAFRRTPGSLQSITRIVQAWATRAG